MNRRNINRKLRKKHIEVNRVISLNALHDLKHVNQLDRRTEFNMLQSECIKPKKIIKVGSRLVKVRQSPSKVIIKTVV